MPPEPLRLGFADLFDGLGTEAVRYSAAAQAMSGRDVVVEGYVAHAHGPGAVLLVSEPGQCPDCSPIPAAIITVQPAQPLMVEGEHRVQVAGRLDYGFRIDAGAASMLRLEDARLLTGASS